MPKKKRDATSKKISKIYHEERKKPRGKRKPRKQIIAQAINMTRRGRRGG